MYRRDFTHFIFALCLSAILYFCLSLCYGFDLPFSEEEIVGTIQEPESQESVSRIPDKTEEPDTADPDIITVYITKTGARYHLSNCRSLYQSQISISLNKAKEQGYTPCGHCRPERIYG